MGRARLEGGQCPPTNLSRGPPFIQAGTCGPSLRPYEALFLRKTYAGAKERAFL